MLWRSLCPSVEVKLQDRKKRNDRPEFMCSWDKSELSVKCPAMYSQWTTTTKSIWSLGLSSPLPQRMTHWGFLFRVDLREGMNVQHLCDHCMATIWSMLLPCRHINRWCKQCMTSVFDWRRLVPLIYHLRWLPPYIAYIINTSWVPKALVYRVQWSQLMFSEYGSVDESM